MARLADVILRDTRAAQPGAATVAPGALYYVTDESVMERSNGAAWQTVEGLGGAPAAAEYLVAAPHGALTAERAATDTPTLAWDFTTPAQAKAAVPNDAITDAKLRNSAALTVIGRSANSVGDPADIAAGVDGQVLRRRDNVLEFAAIVGATTYAAPPAAPETGDLDFTSNAPYVMRFNGTLWTPWGPVWPLVAPIDGDFAWINQGGASVSAVNGGILLSGPATAGDSLRIRKKAAPATPYTITAMLMPLEGKRLAATYGLGFREAGTGKLHLLMLGHYETTAIISIKFTNETTWSATYSTALMNSLDVPLPPRFIRIADDGANRILSYSVDGFVWNVFTTIGRADFLTATEVLFFVNAGDAGVATKVRLLSWEET